MKSFRKQAIAFILLAMMLASSVSVFAADIPDGTTVSFTTSSRRPVQFHVNYGGVSYIGTCAENGLTNDDDGSGTVDGSFSNNSKIAKLVYYYGYVKHWWDGSEGSDEITSGFTKKRAVEGLIQINNQGWSTFFEMRIDPWTGYRNLTDEYCYAVKDLYDNTDLSNIDVPSNFKMYKVSVGNNKQDFYMWCFDPTGKLKLKKASGNTSITG